MHIAMLVAAGLVALAVFYFGAALMGKTRQEGAARFIWVWLAASPTGCVEPREGSAADVVGVAAPWSIFRKKPGPD